MAILSAAQIKAAKDAKIKIVPVEEWGGDVGIKTLSGIERDAIAESQDKKEDHFLERFLTLVICDEGGNRLFTEEDVAELRKKSNQVLNRLFEEALDHNKMTSKSSAEMGGGSPGAPNASSS